MEASPKAEAAFRYAERVKAFMGLVAESSARDPGAVAYYSGLLAQEAAFLVQEGPEAYLRYLVRMEDVAVASAVDRFLRSVFEVDEP